jgi:branched-chain amino acid transport system ATP-binding protein
MSRDERGTARGPDRDDRAATPVLSVEDVHTYYGDSHVLQGVSMHAEAEEVVAILGRNGVGKTTLMRSIVGLTPPRRGAVRFRGDRIDGQSAAQIANAGVGYVPQNRRMFPTLTVAENLRMGLGTAPLDDEQLAYVLELFPKLDERADQAAGTLSGGEQQMVAIGRALMRDPELVLMDEPTEGLMPSLVPRIGEIVARIAAAGYTIVLVEQNVDLALDASDRVYLMERGRIRHEATPAALRAASGEGGSGGDGDGDGEGPAATRDRADGDDREDPIRRYLGVTLRDDVGTASEGPTDGPADGDGAGSPTTDEDGDGDGDGHNDAEGSGESTHSGSAAGGEAGRPNE